MSQELLEWSTIVVSGPDAPTFLDGQLTQTVVAESPDQWALLLEPTGVVLTSLWVRAGDGQFTLLVPRALAERAERRLARFKIRVNCEIEVSHDAQDVPLVDVREQIERRWPWSHEFERSLGPHSFGASFVAATVSFTKGCFTGQELVGRMQARGGSTPWRFVCARGATVELIDQRLREKGPDGPQGVTSARRDADGWRALGFAHRSLLGDTTESSVVVEEVS